MDQTIFPSLPRGAASVRNTLEHPFHRALLGNRANDVLQKELHWNDLVSASLAPVRSRVL